jgi:hypothetical protein
MPGKDLVPRPAVQPPAVPEALPWAADKRETVTAWKWLRRRHHWTLPAFGLPLPVFLAGWAVHAFGFTFYVDVAGVVAFAAILLIGSAKWERRPELLYATASVVVLSAWLTLAGLFGPFHLWLVITELVLIAAWGFFWWRHKRPRGQRKRQKLIGKWDTWWQSHCWHWNLGGSRVIDVWETGLTKKVRVQGIAGRHSIQHVNQVMHLIESGLDGFADIGMVRVEAVRGHPNWFDFYFKQENPLKEPVEYDPALAPRSVHEQIAMWLLESGTWKTIRARCNRFVIGESRSGKSNDLLVGLAALTGCSDDWQILIDLKGGRSARPVLEASAAGHVVTELDEARMTLRLLVAEAKARAKGAYTGDEQLLATDDVPGLHLLVDEVHGLTSVANGDTECAAKLGLVASLGMGLEIYTWIYTQHGSLEESVRTEQTRGNLPVRTVYRVAEARHGAYAIPEYNKLDASKLVEQGTAYTKDGPKATAEQGRAPKMEHRLFKQIAAQNAAMVYRPSLVLWCGDEDAGNGQTWQEWWDTRWTRLDPAFHDISPQYQAATALSRGLSPAEAFAARPQPPEPAPAAAPGEGDAKAAAARIAGELDGIYGGLEDVKPVKVNLAPVIAKQKDDFATALESAPPGGISPTQLKKESGMSEPWVYQQLRALVDLGAVTQIGRGRYVPVAGSDIRQAMAEIRDQAARLYREAKQMVNAA